MILAKINTEELNVLTNLFGKLNIHEDEGPKHFVTGILDIYNHALSEEDAEKFLSSFNDHNLRYEGAYLDFIKELFILNNSHVTIFSPKLDELFKSEDVSFLDEKQLELLERAISLGSEVIKTTSQEVLTLFLILSTREIHFSNFFFLETESIVVGNYDLSFPVYCRNHIHFNLIENIARKIGLFLRK
ncbi:hypothetical protein MJA45_04025 [Paenibacillus aurantius]|uniref:Uncharacterized protein n=1 Tax=Paenibacillus aurantius TaxID=2918900 RepID=A0AA96LIQ9_9BACL|nr:hypothetical protein [Paenibacillus aurantius]WNQ12227.1 hypothetical protein MJA45_04025 [Paenibacillus aurantius]